MNNERIRAAFSFEKPTSITLKEIKEAGFDYLVTSYKNIDSDFLNCATLNNLTVWMEVGCFVGEDLWEKYPESRPIVNGSPLGKLGPEGNKWYAAVIPLPNVIQDRLNLIQQLIEKYPEIEVLYLDFCRFPGRWEDGKNQVVFADNAENDLSTRQKIITEFVQRASGCCKKKGKKVGVFLMPYDNAQYGQNINNLKDSCDYLSPMLYHKICGKPPTWIRERTRHYAGVAGKPVLPLIQTIPEPVPVSLQEFQQVLQQTTQESSLGVMVLSWEAMHKEMKDIFMKNR